MPDKSTPIPRICAACSSPFNGYYSAKYCSDTCRVGARQSKIVGYRAIDKERHPNRHRDYYWRNRERLIAAYDPEKAKARHQATYVPRPTKLYVCTVCGVSVERKYGGRYQRQVTYCSTECENRSPSTLTRRRRLSSQRRGAVSTENINPNDVYDRDGNRCAICSRHLNRALRWPDPKSPSIDHIIPLSLGGAHTLANVRAAHLGCNITRGNREPAQTRMI